jgi:hypothetical protein
MVEPMASKKPFRMLALAAVMVAVTLAGCSSNEAPAEPDDVVTDPAPEVPVLEPAVYEGSTMRLAIFCEGEAKKFNEDHAGWSYVMESAGTPTGDHGYTVWEDADGGRFAADGATEGTVPAEAAAVILCLDVTSQGMSSSWKITITPPAPEAMEEPVE